MFIKSNTKVFIHTTHFLFNIIDSKEFKSKFYWPITEKKFENNYRSSSIDFINNLIDKHHLEQEKVKMVQVIHPHGKKFMSLMLDLIILATKEIVKRRNFAAEKSFDIEEVTEASKNIKNIESDIVSNIKIETQCIKEKIKAIQLLQSKIFPANDFPMTFEEFISSWHSFNLTRMDRIQQQNKKIDSVYQKTSEMVDTAHQMLQPKVYDTFSPPLVVIEEIRGFYENAGASSPDFPEAVTGGRINISWLITQLNQVLPAIVSYVANYTVDPANTSSDELKSLQKYSIEMEKIDQNVDKFCLLWRGTIPAKIAKFKAIKEARQRQEREQKSAEELAEKEAKKRAEVEKLKLLFEPVYYFDATKECLKHVVVKKNRLSLLDDEDGNDNLVNETKLYRSVQTTLANKSKMLPPKPQQRRRFDAMQMLERANQPSSSRNDLNSTTRFGKVGKDSAPKFSSTLLSPDFRQPQFNCSIMSEIQKGSPETSLESIFQNSAKANEQQPRTPLSSLDPELVNTNQSQNNHFVTPKVQVNNDTIDTSNDKSNSTVKLAQRSSSGDPAIDNSSSFSSAWMMNDENLFDTSDTLLRNIED